MNLRDGDRPRRCQQPNCKKKINFTDFKCKCENYYCSIHRLPEQHGCSFDFKGAIDIKALVENMKCVASKVPPV